MRWGLIGAARSQLKNQDLKFEFVPLAEQSQEQAAEPPFSIAFYLKNIGGEDVNAVNARELWARLESKQQFSNWIQNRIEKYGFLQGVDFITKEINLAQESMTYGQGKIDYYISLDMAKELSMVENNEQGTIARRYFIECEKLAKGMKSRFILLEPEIVRTSELASRREV